MGSNRNYRCGCYGQTAASNSDATCCDTCGLNTGALEISATSNGSGNCGCGCAADSMMDEDCCTTCGLTINADGSEVAPPPRPQNPRGCYKACCGQRTGYVQSYAEGNCKTCSNANWNQPDCACHGDRRGNTADWDNDSDCGCKRDNDCDCGCKNSGNGRGRDKGCNSCHSAIVYCEKQRLNETLCAEEALRQGTLFPELAKPMAVVAGCVTAPCATQQQLEAFELWELRLYLNTHPCDECALKLWKQKLRQAECGNYAGAFVPACGENDSWPWLEGSWPWEYQCCGKKRRHCGCGEEA